MSLSGFPRVAWESENIQFILVPTFLRVNADYSVSTSDYQGSHAEYGNQKKT